MVMVKSPAWSGAEELTAHYLDHCPSLTEPEMAALQATATATAGKVNLPLLGMRHPPKAISKYKLQQLNNKCILLCV